MTATTTSTLSPDATPAQSPECTCAHCGRAIPQSSRETVVNGEAAIRFCCRGCAAVYHAINGLGLGYYYRLRGRETSDAARDIAAPQELLYLDNSDFQSERVVQLPDGDVAVTLRLAGIHCAACVWLLEKLPSIQRGVTSSRVEFASGLVKITYTPTTASLSSIVHTVQRLGYTTVVLRHGEVAETVHYNRLFMLRMGIAGFALMNIMIFAVAIYGGDGGEIQPRYTQLFSWVSLLLALPVVCFSSVPFFRTALGGLRAGIFHIDLPISIAVLAGFLLSVVNTLRGSTAIYYDSLTALVFLLLVGRWIQHRTIQRARNGPELARELLPQAASLPDGTTIPLDSVRVGDHVIVRESETVPVDGVVARGSGLLQTAFLTGEPTPQLHAPGDSVLAGSILAAGRLEVITGASGESSKIGEILGAVRDAASARAPLQSFLDGIARGFTLVVLVVAIFTFLYWLPTGTGAAFDRAIALLIVTCPCVLAVATPLTFSLAVLRAATRRLYILDSAAIEGVANVRHVVLDKTGTLTQGQATIEIVYQRLPPGITHSRMLQAISALEKGVIHPVAHALRCFAQRPESPELCIENRIVTGAGVRGRLDDGEWYVGTRQFLESEGFVPSPTAHDAITELEKHTDSLVIVGYCSDVIAVLALADPAKEGVNELISFLRERNISITLASGDRSLPTNAFATAIGMKEEEVRSTLSPEEKAELVRERAAAGTTVMVGDGMNDAIAFAGAHVAIGVQGGAVQCAKSADVFIELTTCRQLIDLFQGSQRTLRVVHRNLWISGLYNAIGGCGAIMGLIGPLEAAILMPLSSITVIVVAARSRTF